MFTVLHTRVILILVIIITILISFIGLNWNREKEKVGEMKARLEVPENMPDSDSKEIQESFYGGVKKIDLASDEGLEGKTIILD